MEIIIKGKMSNDPQDRILAVEAVAKSLSERAGEDPADSVMMLLTAAAHLTQQYIRPGSNIELVMARSLSEAIFAANELSKLRDVIDGRTT